MKYINVTNLLILCAISVILIVACGREDDRRRECTLFGENCVTERDRTGQPGVDGKDGQDGQDGEDGYSIVMTSTRFSGASEFCSNGGIVLVLAQDLNRNMGLDSEDGNFMSQEICNGSNGTDGKDGKDGADGQDGVDGSDGQDGADGKDGQDATVSPLTPVGMIDPCGDKPGVFDEVLLKLHDGRILSSFSDNANGKNTRLSVLVSGTYQTTDGDACVFTVDSLGAVINESHQN